MKRTESYRVKWDEDTIAEHDKDRGTRMVIDEPDTPFVRSPPGEGESCSSSCSLQAASGAIRHDKTTFCLPQVEKNNEIDKSPQGGLEPQDNAAFAGISNSEGNAGVKRSNQGGALASNSGPPLRESDVGLRLEKWLQNPSIEEADVTPKEDKFAKMRKQHYNEFEFVKRMKAEGMNMDGEDDNEDEDDGEVKAGEKSNGDGTEETEGTDENTQRNNKDGNKDEDKDEDTREEGDGNAKNNNILGGRIPKSTSEQDKREPGR